MLYFLFFAQPGLFDCLPRATARASSSTSLVMTEPAPMYELLPIFIGATRDVAPLNIGNNSYIGAGSVITKDVEDDALAVARGKQSNKPGWAKNKK